MPTALQGEEEKQNKTHKTVETGTHLLLYHWHHFNDVYNSFYSNEVSAQWLIIQNTVKLNQTNGPNVRNQHKK